MTNPLNDIRILDANDARGLTRSDIRPAITHADLSGDMVDAANRLGVSIVDLIALRRRAGFASPHRPLSRLHRFNNWLWRLFI